MVYSECNFSWIENHFSSIFFYGHSLYLYLNNVFFLDKIILVFPMEQLYIFFNFLFLVLKIVKTETEIGESDKAS